MRWPGKQLSWKEFVQQLRREWNEDQLGNAAAALTYYGVLALFPFILFTVAVAGVILTPDMIVHAGQSLGKMAPGPAAGVLQQRLQAITQGPNATLLSVGLLGSLWSSSRGITSLMPVLNRCYDVEERRPWWLRQVVAVGVAIGGTIVAIIIAGLLFALPIVGKMLHLPGSLLRWLPYLVAAALLVVAWAAVYWIVPSGKQRFRLLSPGAIVGVLLWLGASWLFSIYVSHFGNYEATYGVLGGVIVLLIWLWVTSLTLLFGAELNRVMISEPGTAARAQPRARDERDRGAPTGAKEPQPA